MSRKYYYIVAFFNLVFGFGYALVIVPEYFGVSSPVNLSWLPDAFFVPAPLFLLVFNVASIVFARQYLRPFDHYARFGFWLSVAILAWLFLSIVLIPLR